MIYCIINGKEALSGDAVIQQLVVPKELGEQILWQFHGTRTMGPFGRVWDQFYWVSLQQRCAINVMYAQRNKGTPKDVKSTTVASGRLTHETNRP